MKLNQSKVMSCNQHRVSTRFHDMKQCKWMPIVSETLCQSLKPLTCINSNKKFLLHLYHFRGAWRAQWWERSPPTNVSRARFPDPASYVGWVCCWFSSLLWEGFLRVLRFSHLLKNQHFQIPFWSRRARAFLYKFLWTPWCSAGKQITFTFFYLHCNLLPPLLPMRLYISCTNLCFP